MNPTVWILIDDEGLVVLHGGKGVEDVEFLASTLFLGYVSMKQALRSELQAEIRELLIPTDRYLMMLVPMPGNTLLAALFPSDTALGLARMGLKKLRDQLVSRRADLFSAPTPTPQVSSTLSSSLSETRERTKKHDHQKKWGHLLRFVRENTPDPAFFLKRLALRTGIPEERLARGDLSTDEFHKVETQIQNLLGISVDKILQEVRR